MAGKQNSKSARMKDVAELAGVSIKTVSRVLNNEPHVQEKLRRKVRDAVSRLDYVPSQSARSLRGNKSYDVMLICHSGNSSYITAIQFGAVVACQELGYRLSISLCEGLGSKPVADIRQELDSMMARHRPDGVMLVAPYASDEKIGFVLEEMGLPLVRIGPVDLHNRAILVEIDDYKAAIELTTHLIDLGHQRIGFVRGLEDQRSTHIRYSGFCVALEAAGLKVDEALVRPGAFDFQSGFEAGEYFIEMDQPPTAVFCSNDDMAAGVVSACVSQGVNVPAAMSVVGFDDADVATRMRPLLTTVHQPLSELGSTAAKELIESLSKDEGSEPRRIVLDYEFVLRDTTAAPPKG
ncbi:LacI family DNA-binding transcriptional regulator [Erythrobacter sp. W53]|uniref:LacI family DNA-binding transcriptional regulator n=1 Tax=Erythrobacter sp. W53 TaxID=3425947 RepID=UPI003D76803E